MGRTSSKTSKENRNVVVSMRVPPRVKAILKAEARRLGVTLGEYVREVLIEENGKNPRQALLGTERVRPKGKP